jgi:hypothetical protein
MSSYAVYLTELKQDTVSSFVPAYANRLEALRAFTLGIISAHLCHQFQEQDR